MSKIGNHVVAIQETEDYRFGWESAERGEPASDWVANDTAGCERLKMQQYGWQAFHQNDIAP